MTEPSSFNLAKVLNAAIKQGASDVHLSQGVPPKIRKDGSLKAFEMEVLTEADMMKILGDLSPSIAGRMAAAPTKPVDFAYSFTEATGKDPVRYRGNATRPISGPSVVLRQFPKIQTMAELGLPTRLQSMTKAQSGLVLLVGATGSGKSTSIAAMLHEINLTQARKIITVEEPIEFVHPNDKKSDIVQFEVGTHIGSFHQGVVNAMRQDPDVILVGEMRDAESAQASISAAKTGHLVFSTLHTTNASSSVERLMDLFPSNQHEATRKALAQVLRAVCFQMLIPKVGGGRIAARELMIVTEKVKQLIDQGKIADIREVMKKAKEDGHTILMDDIVGLAESGTILPREAARRLVGLNPTPGARITDMTNTIQRMYEEELRASVSAKDPAGPS